MLKRMLSFLLALLLCLSSLALLASCANGSSKKSRKKDKEEDEIQDTIKDETTGANKDETTGANKDESTDPNKNPLAVVQSDHYGLSQTILSYYFWSTVDNFLSEYAAYMDYLSLKVDRSSSREDQAKALRSQAFGGPLADGSESFDPFLFGQFSGTWFDYFTEKTKDNVREILVYCEEANRRQLSLPSDQKEAIESALESIEMIAPIYGYTTAQYLSRYYGTGMSLSDLRKAMELASLSGYCQTIMKQEYLAAISDAEIHSRYEANKKDYDSIDYSYYDFSVSYTDAAKLVLGVDYTSEELKKDEAGEKKVLAKYKEMIAEAKKNAETLAAITDKEAFEDFVLDYLCNKYFDLVYAEAAFAADDKTTMTEVKDAVKTEMLRQIKEEIKADKTEPDPATYADGKIFGVAVSEACSKVLQEIKHAVFDDIYADTLAYFRHDFGYVQDSEFSEWAFAGDKVAGQTVSYMNGDGSTGVLPPTTVNPDFLDKSFSVKVYMLTKTPDVNRTKVRNVAYMVFSSEDVAKAAIAALAGKTLTYEVFEQVFHNLPNKSATDTVAKIENYYKGLFGNDSFDAWLFDETTVVGSYSQTPQMLGNTTFFVGFYLSEGEEQWIVDLCDEIAEERMTAGYQALLSNTAVTFDANAFSKIGN